MASSRRAIGQWHGSLRCSKHKLNYSCVPFPVHPIRRENHTELCSSLFTGSRGLSVDWRWQSGRSHRFQRSKERLTPPNQPSEKKILKRQRKKKAAWEKRQEQSQTRVYRDVARRKGSASGQEVSQNGDVAHGHVRISHWGLVKGVVKENEMWNVLREHPIKYIIPYLYS